MHYDIIHAEYLEDYRLKLSFSDGQSGEVDFKCFIERGGVFEVLKDVELFKQFSIDPDWNTIIWQDGEVDFAPETLFFEATGNWPNREQIVRVAEDAPDYGAPSG